MKQPLALNQRGAVLIFSLIMLLLLTLVSVSMIQQNKQELAMTGNTLQQTKSLASAETELKLAEQAIDTARLNPANPTDRTCNSSGASQVNQNQTILTTATGTSTITAVYCLRGTTETQCSSGALNDGSSAACMCDGNRGTEIYTVRWVSTADVNYGAQRTVESKYAVDCSGGPF
ncbi:MAG: PilX N-terminal domain-containing pilus assembly protein [Methylobacter sp.]|jgi:Tfp pilus assembly protein PilX|nr:PilX N-terminal domain-containing pilus assembly protein [Methylobacter sp.]